VALEMRAECERCGVPLGPDGEAYICSYECTYCRGCAEELDFDCRNCNGELVTRPRRVTE
jgi:hypothetical protein